MDTNSVASSRPNRRTFLKVGLAAGAGVAGTAFVGLPALTESEASSSITKGRSGKTLSSASGSEEKGARGWGIGPMDRSPGHT